MESIDPNSATCDDVRHNINKNPLVSQHSDVTVLSLPKNYSNTLLSIWTWTTFELAVNG